MLPQYGGAIRERLSVAPGLTGLAQVCGSRQLATADVYALEIWGTRHRTADLTLRIVVMTPLFILGWRKIGRPVLNRLPVDPSGLQVVTGGERELNRAITVSCLP